MFGTLEPAEIEEVLLHQVVGRIGCHADGTTYVVPVSFAYDGQQLYVRSFEGKKIAMMRANPSVCFQTDIITNMANWKSVVAWGVFEELQDPQQRRVALHALVNRKLPLVSSETTHLSGLWPFVPDDLNDISGIVFRIVLQNKTGRFEQL